MTVLPRLLAGITRVLGDALARSDAKSMWRGTAEKPKLTSLMEEGTVVASRCAAAGVLAKRSRTYRPNQAEKGLGASEGKRACSPISRACAKTTSLEAKSDLLAASVGDGRKKLAKPRLGSAKAGREATASTVNKKQNCSCRHDMQVSAIVKVSVTGVSYSSSNALVDLTMFTLIRQRRSKTVGLTGATAYCES